MVPHKIESLLMPCGRLLWQRRSGPMVDQIQLSQDTDYIAIGSQEGAKLAFGGKLSKRDTPGSYLLSAAGAVY